MDFGSSKGLFDTAGQGRNFRRRRGGAGALDRFAEELSLHIDEADLAAGRNLATGAPLSPAHRALGQDPGGDARRCAVKLGFKPNSGNMMLQRIRKRLGPQAC